MELVKCHEQVFHLIMNSHAMNDEKVLLIRSLTPVYGVAAMIQRAS